MSKDECQLVASFNLRCIQAAAGCGKTTLISNAVSYGIGRQLILTHTYAGVRALRNHLLQARAPESRFQVTTIDGWALRFASAFPTLSNWRHGLPKTEQQWQELRTAATLAIKFRAVAKTVRESYDGMYVDEYQDCSVQQHDLIVQLSTILPCRVFGDPLQAIYSKINGDSALLWSSVEEYFGQFHKLTTPHRWLKHNPELGTWLTAVREDILAGRPIDLAKAPRSVRHIKAVDFNSQIGQCYALIKRAGNSVAIHGRRNLCYALAKSLKNNFVPLERVECEELAEYAEQFEKLSGVHRVKAFCRLLDDAAAGVGWFGKQAKRVVAGNPIRVSDDSKVAMTNTLCNLRDNHTPAALLAAMKTASEISGIVFKRPGLWNDEARCWRADHHRRRITSSHSR